MKKNTVTADQVTAANKHKYERMTFFGSFRDALSTLGPRKKLLAYDSILDYGLDDVRRENLPRDVESIMIMAIPQIDASHRRYRDGMKGKVHGIKGAEHGIQGGRPSKKDEVVELNSDGEIDKNDL